MYAYVHVYACQYCAEQSFFDGRGLSGINPCGRCQLVKMLITLYTPIPHRPRIAQIATN